MELALEPIENGSEDRCADRFELLLNPSYLVQIGGSRSDDQDDRVNDAREQQRIVGCQNRRRVEEHHAEGLGDRPE